MTTMPKAGKYDYREPVRAMQFGPSYVDAWNCYEWVVSLIEPHKVSTDINLGMLYIGADPTMQVRAGLGWWVVWEDEKFQVYTDEKFHKKFKKAPESLSHICVDHKPKQHRDMKEPWCNNCGLNMVGKLPSVGAKGQAYKRGDVPVQILETYPRTNLEEQKND